MMAYLKGITKASQEAQIKMEMKSEKGKLIYPRQIKRELGAKLIYDAICPIATGAFYGFNPYEKEYGNMVAEDMGGSYEKCEQIASVAIEIEKHIKELSEQELRDETIVKVILQHCFDDKEDISAMAKGGAAMCDGAKAVIEERVLLAEGLDNGVLKSKGFAIIKQ